VPLINGREHLLRDLVVSIDGSQQVLDLVVGVANRRVLTGIRPLCVVAPIVLLLISEAHKSVDPRRSSARPLVSRYGVVGVDGRAFTVHGAASFLYQVVELLVPGLPALLVLERGECAAPRTRCPRAASALAAVFAVVLVALP
jgi:hypothetical protein